MEIFRLEKRGFVGIVYIYTVKEKRDFVRFIYKAEMRLEEKRYLIARGKEILKDELVKRIKAN